MKMVSKNFLILLIVCSSFSACTRTDDKKELADASIVITKTVEDARIPIRPIQNARAQSSLKLSNTHFATVDYLRMIDDLNGLAALTRDDQISSLARALYDSFYTDAGNYTHTTFSKSIMIPSIVGEGEPVIREQTALMEHELRASMQKMSNLLRGSVASFPWPKKLNNLNEGIGAVDSYVDWLMKQIPLLRLSNGMELGAMAGISGEYKAFRPKIVGLVEGLNRAKTLAQSLVAVKRVLKDLEVRLKAPQAAKLKQADALAAQIAEVDEEPQDALTLLVMVWEMTPPKERGSFKKISPEMYDYFADKSDDQLECLAMRGCPNPVLGISKLVIFRKLDEYGLEKIARQIDKSARDTILETVHQQVTALLPQIPSEVNKKILAEASKYLATIQLIQKDVVGFTKSHLEKWSNAKFKQPLRGLEVANVTVSLGGSRDIRVTPVVAAGRVLRTGAATLGASLSLAHSFLPEEDGPRMRAAMVEPLMKMMAIGGFRVAEGQLYPSFLLALDGALDDFFNLKKLMTGTTSFAVPDEFVANGSFMMNRKNASRTASVMGQAELLKGISRQIRFHRDWEKNLYDISLGSIQMKELLSDMPGAEAISTSLLPKDIIFTLALGNAGAMLQNMIYELSPAFLVLEKGGVLWGNQYKEIKGDNVSAVAGLVSIENGKRTDLVKTADLARYVLALDEFMGATEGMEQTNSSVLKSPTDEGKSTMIADLVEIRKKLLLLQMGLSNYLVSVAQQKGGGIAESFRVASSLSLHQGVKRLEDHTLTIRALLASATRLELPLFRKAALDAFYNLNRSFFDPTKQFYAAELDEEGKPAKAATIQEISLTLLAGEELSAHMPSETRSQWERMSAPWIRAFQEL